MPYIYIYIKHDDEAYIAAVSVHMIAFTKNTAFDTLTE
jgi:hypothetical protein